MSILSTSLGLTRYRVVEGIPDSLWREVPKRLADNAFHDIDDSVDERSFGWCNIDNMHLLLVLVIALLVFGPGKLPQLGASIGKSIRELRKGLDGTDAPSQPTQSSQSTDTRK